MELKTQLKSLMDQHSINAFKLSKVTGVPNSTISDWLAGSNPKSIIQVKKIADFFEVTLDFLCFGETKDNTNAIDEYSDEINAGLFEVVLRRKK